MPRPRILDHRGNPLPSAGPTADLRALRARYDAAQTSTENANHWGNADSLSARTANSPEVRFQLRKRARYERDNNTYCSGMAETLANDTIGTGPRLQLRTEDRDLNRRVADAFEEWTAACGLAEKLRTYREARAIDGEGFLVMLPNPALPTAVKLDLRDYEADQVTSPFSAYLDDRAVDGIEFDRFGNPSVYHVLREHPGDFGVAGLFGQFDRVPAWMVLHWFKKRRAGQVRGVPEVTPALWLYAVLRRYTMATLSSAEVAALFAVLLKTTMPPDADTPPIAPYDTTELVRGQIAALPEGYEAQQMKPEHPATTYDQFEAAVIRSIARCLNMPFNVAAGNSSGYNYASGRLDHQVYHRMIGVDRYFLETHVLDRVLRVWLNEARLADPALVEGLDFSRLPRHRWGWDGFRHIDPSKEAVAQSQRLVNGTTTLEMECAEDGNDWREVADQTAQERAYYEELGLPYPGDNAATLPAPEPAQRPPPTTEATMPVRRLLRASAPPNPSSLSLQGTAVVEFQAAKDGEPARRPTFTITGYTGAPMSVAGFYSPVVVDLAGLKASRERIPILLDHDASRIIGQGTPTIDASGVQIVGTITGDDAHANSVVTHAKNGFEWQASIGASIVRQEFLKAGETAVVNGRDVSGPLLIARESRLQETSFVAIGADNQTSATVAASLPSASQKGAPIVFEQWLQAKGFDPTAVTDVQRTSLQAMYDAEEAHKAKSAGSTAGKHAAGDPPTAAQPPTPNASNLQATLAELRADQARVAEIERITSERLLQLRYTHPEVIDALDNLSRTHIEARTDPRTYELELLRATMTLTGPTGPNFNIHGTNRDSRTSARMIEAAVCRAAGLESLEKSFDTNTLQASHERFSHGLGLQELVELAARDNGWTGHSYRTDPHGVIRAAFSPNIRAQGWTTISLPTLLGNVANKFITDGFNAVESTWKGISSRRSLTDFKTVTTAALTGGFTYQKVGVAGEIKHATVGELTYTLQADTYARMIAVTRKDIINDDLGVFDQVREKLGRGAANSINRDFWTVFMNNSAFFTSGRGNAASGAGTVLSIAALTQAETLFLNQTDPDGDPVAISPTILLVPNALTVTGANLMNSTTVANDTTANTITLGNNPHAGKYTLLRSSYLSNAAITGNSTTAYYLLANPNELSTIEVGFVGGKDTPTVDAAEADFNTLGFQWRGLIDYAIGLKEYRAGVRMAGA
jgi:lambda family phage portal protein